MCDGCLLNTQWTSYPLRCPLEPLYNFVQSFVVVPTVSTRHCLTSSALSRYDDWWSTAAANVWFDWSALTTAQVVSWSQMSTLQKRWDTPRACKEIPHSNTCVWSYTLQWPSNKQEWLSDMLKCEGFAVSYVLNVRRENDNWVLNESKSFSCLNTVDCWAQRYALYWVPP